MEIPDQLERDWYSLLREIVGDPGIAPEQLAYAVQEKTFPNLARKQGAKFIILTGPSGAGKTTVGELLECGGISRFVAHATRKPRASDVPGQSYHFVDTKTFEAMAKRGDFIWYIMEESRPEHHGILAADFLRKVEAGQKFYIDAGNRTAKYLPTVPAIKKIPYLFAMVLPPSFKALIERLKTRQVQEKAKVTDGQPGETMTDSEIVTRLNRTISLLNDTRAFVDFYLVNDTPGTLKRTIDQVVTTIHG